MSNKQNPPSSIVGAAVLSFLPIPLAFVRLLLLQAIPLSFGRLVAWLLVATLFGWISLSLYRGKKWSWWWIVISTAAGTLLMFYSPQFPKQGADLLIYWLQFLCIWLACVFLLLPSNRKWFAA